MVERIDRNLELKVEIIQLLSQEPMTFDMLANRLGVSTEVGKSGAYSKKYRRLLDAVTGLQQETKRNPVPFLATAVRPLREERKMEYFLYPRSEEENLIKKGKIRIISVPSMHSIETGITERSTKSELTSW